MYVGGCLGGGSVGGWVGACWVCVWVCVEVVGGWMLESVGSGYVCVCVLESVGGCMVVCCA